MNTHLKTLILTVGVILGVAVGEVSVFSSEIAIFLMVAIFIYSSLYFFEKRKINQTDDILGINKLSRVSIFVLLFFSGLFLGIIRCQLLEEKINFICADVCTFEGEVISSPEIKNDYQIFYVHPILNNSNDVRYVMLTTSLYPKYKIGETLRIIGKVNTPKIIFPHNNGNKNFDYSSYLLTKNIGSEVFYPKIELLDTEAHTLKSLLGRFKEDLVYRIDMNVSSPASSLANGMLLGESSLSKESSQTFKIAGLSHIIVLSGFNIAIVISSILFVFATIPFFLRIILASLSVIIFVIMVGAEPSVIRATLMAFIGLLAMSIGREYVARQALIISLLVMIIYNPLSIIYDPSLHLSFLATAGIIYLSNPIKIIFNKYFPYINSSSLKELLITTMSAYLATLPYIMYAFGGVSVYAIISNILVLPFVPIAMLLSFFVIVGSFIFPPINFILGFVVTSLINFILFVARIIESLPFSYLDVSISFFGMILFYLIIFIIGVIILKNINETQVTQENNNLTDVISY